MAPTTTTGLGGSGKRSQAKAVSSITSVPWTTTAPSISGRASCRSRMPPISRTCSNERWEAGTRPHSIGSMSAIAASPGADASNASPPRVGTLPAGPASLRIEMVPPVKTTAMRAIGAVCRAPGSSAGRGRRVPRQDIGDGVDVRRLDEVVIEAGRDRLCLLLGMTPTGEGDDEHRAAPRLGPYSARDLVAVQLRQADVEQHHFRPQGPRELQRRRASVRRVGLVALELEQARERIGGVAVVVDDEDAMSPGGLGLRDGFGRRHRQVEQDRQVNTELAALAGAGA